MLKDFFVYNIRFKNTAFYFKTATTVYYFFKTVQSPFKPYRYMRNFMNLSTILVE